MWYAIDSGGTKAPPYGWWNAGTWCVAIKRARNARPYGVEERGKCVEKSDN